MQHYAAAVLSLLAGASALTAKAPAKAILRDMFAGRADGILACPSTKEPLRRQTAVLGGFSRVSLSTRQQQKVCSERGLRRLGAVTKQNRPGRTL